MAGPTRCARRVKKKKKKKEDREGRRARSREKIVVEIRSRNRDSRVRDRFQDRIDEGRKWSPRARYHLSSIYFTISNDIGRAFRLAPRNVDDRSLIVFCPTWSARENGQSLSLSLFSFSLHPMALAPWRIQGLMLPRTSSVVGYHGQSCVTWLTAPFQVTFLQRLTLIMQRNFIFLRRSPFRRCPRAFSSLSSTNRG